MTEMMSLAIKWTIYSTYALQFIVLVAGAVLLALCDSQLVFATPIVSHLQIFVLLVYAFVRASDKQALSTFWMLVTGILLALSFIVILLSWPFGLLPVFPPQAIISQCEGILGLYRQLKRLVFWAALQRPGATLLSWN